MSRLSLEEARKKAKQARQEAANLNVYASSSPARELYSAGPRSRSPRSRSPKGSKSSATMEATRFLEDKPNPSAGPMLKWLGKSDVAQVAPILDGIQDSKLMGSTSPTRRTFSPTRSSPTAGTGSTDRGPGSAYRASRMSYEDLAMDQFSKEKIMDKLEDARGECRIMAAKLADAQADLRDTQRELQAEKLANSDLEQKVALSQKRANQAEKAMGDVLKSSPAQRSIHLIEEQIENERVWTKEMSALQATIEPLQAQLEDAAAQRYSLQGYLREAKQQAQDAEKELES